MEKNYLPQLEAILGDFFMREKGREALRRAAEKTLAILAEEVFSFDLELKALDAPVKSLEQKLERFRKEMKRIEDDAFDARVLFGGEINRLLQELDLDLDRFRCTETSRMIEGLGEAHEDSRSLSVSQYGEAMETYVQEEIVKALDSWLEKENSKLEEAYARVASRFAGRIDQIVQKILDISSGLFDLPLKIFESQETLDPQSSPYFTVGNSPKFFDLEGTLRFLSRSLLRKSISQRMIPKDLKAKPPEIVDRNCRRVRSDFVQRLQNSHLQFRWELGPKIDATRDSIESAVSKTIELRHQSEKAVAECRAMLEARRSRLKEIKLKLTECLNAVSGEEKAGSMDSKDEPWTEGVRFSGIHAEA